jgi:hypothetical protein
VTLRDRIDRIFEAWGRAVCARRYLVLGLCLLFLATMATFLPDMRMENSSQSYLHTADPASLEYEKFQRRFGQDDRILIAIGSPEIFELAFLERLRAFHEELESVLPYVREVTSLVNVRQTRGEDDALIVEDLMEDWPETPEDLEDLRRRVFANPLYVDNVISRNGGFTTLWRSRASTSRPGTRASPRTAASSSPKTKSASWSRRSGPWWSVTTAPTSTSSSWEARSSPARSPAA